MSVRVLLVGGGTAGHFFPCLAVAEQLAELAAGAAWEFIGARGRIDARLLSERGLPHHLISARPLPYRLSPALLGGLAGLVRGCAQTRGLIRRFRPDVLLSTGGFVGAAVVPAARMAGVPVVLHVADAHPDRSNRLLARWARAITVASPAAAEFFRREVVVTGHPIRAEVASATREQGLQGLGLSAERPVLVVTGGSQGARTLNNAVLQALPALLDELDLQVVHQSGHLEHEQVRAAAAERVGERADYRLFDLLPNPGPALAAATLFVTRASAGGPAEGCLHGLPMILVPYPYAGGHQRANAKPLAEAGAAIVVEDSEFDGARLLEIARELLSDPGRLERMSQASRRAARPHAAAEVARVVLNVARATGARLST